AELHSVNVCCFFNGQRLFPLNHAHTITNNACSEDVAHTQNAQPVRGSGKGMNTRTDSTKLAKLQELDSLLPREILGQPHALLRNSWNVGLNCSDRRPGQGDDRRLWSAASERENGAEGGKKRWNEAGGQRRRAADGVGAS